MSDEEMRAELDRLRSENAALKKTSSKGISMKVSEKGGLSIYGLGRFPITLYKEQWTKLLDMADDIRDFLKANDAQLKAKG
jgi:hypothetical protein